MNSTPDEAQRFAIGLGELHKSLRDGGPEVDWSLLQLYHDQLLEQKASKCILRLIVTWRSWYDAHIDIIEIDQCREEELQNQ